MEGMVKLVDAEVKRETEKALLINLDIDTQVGRRGFQVWLPKSTVEISAEGIFAAVWIIEKKHDEIDAQVRGFYGISVEQLVGA